MAQKSAARRRPTKRELTRDAPAAAPVYGILRQQMYRVIPREEVNRPHLGRSVDLTRIDYAIRQANRGYMRALADLALETIRLDGHASALWQKRLNRLAALDWDVRPAKGEGIDEQRAEDYAGMVREQLEQIPNFRQCLMDVNQGTYHGRAASEIEWLHYRGKWRVANLHWIHARRLSFGPQRDLRIVDLTRDWGNFDDAGFALEQVPYKFIAFKPRMFGDYPEREGLAPRTVFWSFFGRFGVRERMHLLEVFGKPWRIAMPRWDPNNPTALNEETVDDAYQALNSLGAQSTASLPINMEVMVAQPQRAAGQVHGEAIDHVEKIISKLFVGATGTTDAISTGIGSNVGNIHLNEEDLMIASDAWRLSEAIEDQLTDPIIIVNEGPEAVTHAPKFAIKTDPPKDLKLEAELIQAILELGVDMSEAEIRERIGIREIKPDEILVRRVPRNINGTVPMYLPLPEVIHPNGTPQGELPDIPAVRGAIKPPPPPEAKGAAPALPSGGTTPLLPAAPELTGDGAAIELDDAPKTDEAVAALAAKMTEHGVERCAHGKLNRCQLCGIERVRDFDLNGDGLPDWKVMWRPIGSTATPAPAIAARATVTKRRLNEPKLGFGDGGMHQHYVDRKGDKLVLGGEHAHAFLIDGHVIFSEVDGPHEHLEHAGWENDGVHYHRVGIPGGGTLDTEIGGRHGHGRGVSITGVDGAHTHALKLTDGRVINSLTPEELAEVLEDAEDAAAE
jgi:phage gp29-like protein